MAAAIEHHDNMSRHLDDFLGNNSRRRDLLVLSHLLNHRVCCRRGENGDRLVGLMQQDLPFGPENERGE